MVMAGGWFMIDLPIGMMEDDADGSQDGSQGESPMTNGVLIVLNHEYSSYPMLSIVLLIIYNIYI